MAAPNQIRRSEVSEENHLSDDQRGFLTPPDLDAEDPGDGRPSALSGDGQPLQTPKRQTRREELLDDQRRDEDDRATGDFDDDLDVGDVQERARQRGRRGSANTEQALTAEIAKLRRKGRALQEERQDELRRRHQPPAPGPEAEPPPDPREPLRVEFDADDKPILPRAELDQAIRDAIPKKDPREIVNEQITARYNQLREEVVGEDPATNGPAIQRLETAYQFLDELVTVGVMEHGQGRQIQGLDGMMDFIEEQGIDKKFHEFFPDVPDVEAMVDASSSMSRRKLRAVFDDYRDYNDGQHGGDGPDPYNAEPDPEPPPRQEFERPRSQRRPRSMARRGSQALPPGPGGRSRLNELMDMDDFDHTPQTISEMDKLIDQYGGRQARSRY